MTDERASVESSASVDPAAGGRGADGRPFPATMSLTRDAFLAFDREEWQSVLRHELVHLEQYQRFGTTGHGSAFRDRADPLSGL